MTSGGATKNSNQPSAIVPDGGWGWMIVFASFMIHFIMDGITYSLGDVFLQPIRERFNSNRGSVSVIFGLLPAITLATGPIATIFTNRYGCREVTIGGTLLVTIGFLISSIIANLWVYYVAIGVIGGLGFGLIYLPAIVSVGNYFEKKRSFAMGIAVSGSGLGTLVFPYIMEWIIDDPLWFDYDGALLLETAIIFICVIFGMIMIPLPHERSEVRRLEKKARALNKQKLNDQSEKDEEVKDRLLSPKDKKQDIQLEQVNDQARQSTAVVPRREDDREEKQEKDKVDDHDDTSVVLSRKDAIYQGSLHNIPQYNDDVDEYHAKIMKFPSEDKTEGEISKKKEEKSFLGEIAEQIDLKLLRDVVFFLFAVSNFLTSLGFNIPYNFAKDLAIDAQVDEQSRNRPIMAIGISNCFGRLVIGYLADNPKINRLYLYNTTLIIAGAAMIFAPLSNSWILTHIAYASFFGFFSGGYVGLTSVIVVDLVGVDKLTDAFGTLLLFQGVAVALGTPIAATMRDWFSDLERPYLWPYLIFGTCVLISGLMLFAIPTIRKYQERRRPVDPERVSMGVQSYSTENISHHEKNQNI